MSKQEGRSKKPGLVLERRRSERLTPEGMEAADSSSSVVRVDFRRLDAMLEVLGESLIEQAAVAELYRVLVRKLGPTNELVDLDRGLIALQKTMKRLEGILMETRLLPISTVFGRFPRLVRELAQAKQKQVHVVTTGGEIPLDKAVLDRISEPLVHLLTNAVVHGIESPEERARAGKPAEGTLSLRASSESGRVVIRLTDDGRGLDDSRILAKAQTMGSRSNRADTEQLHSLIFLPGFSTAEQVSSLAGRGVGLDVVANTVHELGGTIEVESRPGQGVTFTLSLPVTLAILRSLIVEVDRERYAVPISHVAATVRTEPDTIHQVNQKGVALWRGNLIHVCDGGALLGTGAGANTSRRFYVVISMGSRTRGILVDRLIGHQDIVVKSLDPTLGRPEVVSGTTILGDGKVACILDAAPHPGPADVRVSAAPGPRGADSLLRFADELQRLSVATRSAEPRPGAAPGHVRAGWGGVRHPDRPGSRGNPGGRDHPRPSGPATRAWGHQSAGTDTRGGRDPHPHGSYRGGDYAPIANHRGRGP